MISQNPLSTYWLKKAISHLDKPTKNRLWIHYQLNNNTSVKNSNGQGPGPTENMEVQLNPQPESDIANDQISALAPVDKRLLQENPRATLTSAAKLALKLGLFEKNCGTPELKAQYLKDFSNVGLADLADLSTGDLGIYVLMSATLIQQRRSNQSLSESEIRFLTNLPALVSLAVSKLRSESFSFGRFVYPVGTVTELTLDLKVQNRFVQTVHKISATASSGTQKTVNKPVENLKIQTASIKLLCLINYCTSNAPMPVILENISTYLWNNNLSKLYTSQVCLESVKLKAVHPITDSKGGYTISMAIPGEARGSNLEPSSKVFAFSYYSEVLQNTKNSYTLRLPFVATPIGSSGSNTPEIMAVADKIAKMLGQPIAIPNVGLGLSLMLKSISSRNAEKFSTVDYISVSGFMNNLKPSRYNLNPLSQPTETLVSADTINFVETQNSPTLETFSNSFENNGQNTSSLNGSFPSNNGGL